MSNYPLNLTPRDLDIFHYAYSSLPPEERPHYLFHYLYNLSLCGEDVFGRQCYGSRDALSLARLGESTRDLTRMSRELVVCLEGRRTTSASLEANLNACASEVNHEELVHFEEFPHRPYDVAPQMTFSLPDAGEGEGRGGSPFYSASVPSGYEPPPALTPELEAHRRAIQEAAARHRTSSYADNSTNRRAWGEDLRQLQAEYDGLLAPLAPSAYRHLGYFYRNYMRFHEARTRGGLNRRDPDTTPIRQVQAPRAPERYPRYLAIALYPVTGLEARIPHLSGLDFALSAGVDLTAHFFGTALHRRTPREILSLSLEQQRAYSAALRPQLHVMAGYRHLFGLGASGFVPDDLFRFGAGLDRVSQRYEQPYPGHVTSLRGVFSLFPQDGARYRGEAEWVETFGLGSRGWYVSLGLSAGVEWRPGEVTLVGQANASFGTRWEY